MSKPNPAAPAGFGFASEPASGKFLTTQNSVSTELVNRLHDLGVRHAFGLIGGANAAFADALGKSAIRVVHCRHEGGAGFAATEAHFASGAPTMVFATTGPGILNALNGITAARWEGAKVILVSGVTSAAQRGRSGAQETGPATMPYSGLFTEGPIFDFATVIETPEQLTSAVTRIQRGLQAPGGFVAHIALPIALQRALTASAVASPEIRYQPPAASSEVIDQCVELFRKERFAIWVGFGARECAEELRELVELTGAPVMATPRAKGIFPEDHQLYLGVTGMGGHERVYESLDISAVDRILVLGTRMGEGSSFWSPRLVPHKGFVHIDVDPVVFGLAYPEAQTLGIQSEIKAFLRGLLARRAELSYRPVERRTPSIRVTLGSRPGRVRTAFLMQEIQRVVVNGSDALVMTESGNAFVWGNGSLSFRTPGRYRVSVGYGSMGHFTVGAFGAALATSRRVFAVVGDGSMLMNNEINTAVQYGARAVWVILNDGRYGMVEQGMRATGYAPLDVSFPEVDFVAVAKGMGADGVHVRDESEIHSALQQALEAEGPFVIDVATDPTERSPVLARVKSLVHQGG